MDIKRSVVSLKNTILRLLGLRKTRVPYGSRWREKKTHIRAAAPQHRATTLKNKR